MRGSLCASTVALALGVFGCTAEDKVLEADDSGVNSGGSDAGGNGASNGTSNGTNRDGGGSAGGDSGSDAGEITGGVASDPACDMNGIWIGRQITRSVALGTGQFANNYYYLELTQNGDEVVVSKHFDCGVIVRGFATTVQLSRATLEALMLHNLQKGRAGSLKKNGDRCDFAMERFWSVRGADEARFVPTPRNTGMTLAAVAAAKPLPTKDKTDGAEDWENDGVLGVAWQVSIGNNVRNTVQRDWTEWFTDDEFTIVAAPTWSKDLVVRSKFDAEEQLIAASSESVSATSTVDGQAKHTMTLRFLGRSLQEAKAKGVLGATDFETCTNIRNALPAQDRF